MVTFVKCSLSLRNNLWVSYRSLIETVSGHMIYTILYQKPIKNQLMTQTHLQFLDLALERPPHLVDVVGVFLFLSHFLSQSGGVGHCLLGGVLGRFQLVGLVLEVALYWEEIEYLCKVLNIFVYLSIMSRTLPSWRRPRPISIRWPGPRGRSEIRILEYE